MKKNKIRLKKISQKDLFHNSTKTVVKMCEKIITNKQVREQTISVIKAVDGKKIRNTSGV